MYLNKCININLWSGATVRSAVLDNNFWLLQSTDTEDLFLQKCERLLRETFTILPIMVGSYCRKKTE